MEKRYFNRNKIGSSPLDLRILSLLRQENAAFDVKYPFSTPTYSLHLLRHWRSLTEIPHAGACKFTYSALKQIEVCTSAVLGQNPPFLAPPPYLQWTAQTQRSAGPKRKKLRTRRRSAPWDRTACLSSNPTTRKSPALACNGALSWQEFLTSAVLSRSEPSALPQAASGMSLCGEPQVLWNVHPAGHCREQHSAGRWGPCGHLLWLEQGWFLNVLRCSI